MNGDPIVRQIVKKMYGEDPETGEGYGEMVCLYESQVIVSRETLATLLDMADNLVFEYGSRDKENAALDEAREALGS